MAAVCHFDFTKFWYFTSLTLKAKFASALQISLKLDDSHLRYIAIKLFSKWHTSAILDFRNLVFWSRDPCLVT